MSSNLFKPLKLGNIQLQNRVVMAPLTRFRADDEHVPLPFVPEYYAQRGSVPGTLLISEATFIAPRAGGYGNAPGIWSDAQIASWKNVTSAVHAKGSFIYLQLWALGRAASPGQLKKELGQDAKVVGASDIPFEGGATPTPLTETEIKEYIGLYAQAAKNAVAAGFDGVEIHGANGYLIDQFLQDVSNNRTDAWGGSVENRARFGIEVAKAVVAAVGPERTGIRLSPFSEFQGMRMADPRPQFSYFAQELKKLKLAYIHLVESRIAGNADVEQTDKVNFLVDLWDNQSPVLIAGGFTSTSAKPTVDEEFKDKDVVIVFGRYFISNPDLVFRLKERIEFTPYDREKFYNKGQKDGYITWKFSKEFEAQAAKL
ncbi:NADPH dehydrogenase [Hyaloscypha variabilis F]|uniref:NADPH dehydrogenase n=1 Tax=Hyaloscypha variabilis (strain UAMH 11265 / GT02V1 / F) TaxID=1149755 RepID=A0A2J6RTC1_HYAVF|nr:NADPH dehydrogenase [Hyaloscypha variabilis F]